MKTRFFDSRFFLTHPQTVTVLASGSDVNKSLISMGFIIILLYIFINEPSIFWGTVPQANALQKFKKGLEETDESAGIFIKLYYN